jgi:TctA family transporter
MMALVLVAALVIVLAGFGASVGVMALGLVLGACMGTALRRTLQARTGEHHERSTTEDA